MGTYQSGKRHTPPKRLRRRSLVHTAVPKSPIAVSYSDHFALNRCNFSLGTPVANSIVLPIDSYKSRSDCVVKAAGRRQNDASLAILIHCGKRNTQRRFGEIGTHARTTERGGINHSTTLALNQATTLWPLGEFVGDEIIQGFHRLRHTLS